MENKIKFMLNSILKKSKCQQTNIAYIIRNYTYRCPFIQSSTEEKFKNENIF